MGNKKKIIIAIIIFIFAGLMIFTFANPATDDEFLNGKDSVVKEDDENSKQKEEDFLNTENDLNHVNGVNNILNQNAGNNAVINNLVQAVDNSYELALKAVINAEEKLNEVSYNEALDLVNKVTDNRKADLIERLENVKKIVDTKALLKELENKTYNATNKSDMDDARKFKDDNDVVSKISNVSNQALKEELQKRLVEVLELLNDTKSPVILGIKDNSFVRSNVSVNVSDENDITILLNDNVVEEKDLENISKEGKYVLIVTDKAYNEIKLEFVIDKTSPVIKGIDDGGYYNYDVVLEIIEENLQNAKLSKNGGKARTYESGTPITDEGNYELKVVDKAYNKKAIVRFTIDKTAPKVVDIKQQYEEKQGGRVKVTIKTNEEIFADYINEYGWRKVSDTEYYTYYYKTKDVKLEFTDKALNKGAVSFKTDLDAPKISIKDGSYLNHNVSPRINEKNIISSTLKMNDGNESNYPINNGVGREISKEGKYTLTVTDVTGNSTSVTFTIDKTAPEFKGIKNGIYYQDDITVSVDDKNLDKITAKVYKENYNVVEIENNTKLTKESIYYLTATDKAGNSNSIYVAVDKTNPVFVGLQNGHQYNKDLVVNVEDLKVKTIEVFSYNDGTTKEVKNGYVISEEGTYNITATDYSGRKTKVTVALDKTAPSLKVDDVVNGNCESDNPQIHATDKNKFEIILKKDGKIVRTDNAVLSANKVYSVWYGIGYMTDGNYEVEAIDRAGNSKVIKFNLVRFKLLASKSGSVKI